MLAPTRSLSGYLARHNEPGRDAEVDFGKLWVRLDGVMTRCHLFVLRLAFSGMAVHPVYPTPTQETLLDGHAHAFAVLGGIPTWVMRYDNLTAAVEKLLSAPPSRGDTLRGLISLKESREMSGDTSGTERLAQRDADTGHIGALTTLANLRLEAGDMASGERLALQAIDAETLDHQVLATLERSRRAVGERCRCGDSAWRLTVRQPGPGSGSLGRSRLSTAAGGPSKTLRELNITPGQAADLQRELIAAKHLGGRPPGLVVKGELES